jgi:hypothetical protein
MDGIKMWFKEIGFENKDELPGSVHWLQIVNTSMHFRVPFGVGNSLTSWRLAPEEGLYYMQKSREGKFLPTTSFIVK